jgi:hypothetical protein
MRVALLPILSRSLLLKPAVLIPLVAAVLLPGCASKSPGTAQLDCAVLKQVIDTARTDLSGLAATRTNTLYGSVWRAKIDAYGSGCTLFGTTDVPSRYFCTIPAAADSSVLAALQEEVASCLGSGWQRNPATARSAERFSRASDDIVVDVGASDVNASRAEVIGLLVRHRQP